MSAIRLALVLWFAALPALAQPLAGRVTSPREGAMEGVIVSAVRDGSPITVSVVTNAEGRYAFPANRLTPGQYKFDIRAAGYELAQPVTLVVSAQPATADLALRATNDLAIQLTNAEWMDSIPVPYADKHFLRNCTNCHRLTLPLMSAHSAEEFVDVQQRMTTYAAASSPLLPQKLLRDRVANLGELALERRANVIRQQALFLAQVNLNGRETWLYPLQPRPRATGRATRVVITEYDLPAQTRMPHDVIVTPDGMVWYNSFAEQILGKLDPATGAVKEFVVPTLKPNAPLGGLALRADAEGQVWMGLAYQAGVARFDPKSETFRMYPLPAPQNQDHTQTTEVEPRHMHVDGKVWIEDSGTYSIYRMDVKTGAIEVFQPFPIPSPNVYDITTDEQNNVYFSVFGRGDIGRVDAKTGEIRTWPTPTKMSSPRRGTLDVKTGRLWFGEFAGDRIGMFDTKTETVREFPPPNPYTFPYDALADRNGEVWSGNMSTDRVQRLNPETGQYVEYPLPRSTNIRRVWVDNSTTPVTFWAGNNHGASIVRVEPLD